MKDVYLKKVTEKIPLMPKISKKMTTFFEGISIKMVMFKYSRSSAKFEKLYAAFARFNTEANIPSEQLEIIQRKINQLKRSYDQDFGIGTITSRIHSVKEGFNGLEDKAWTKFKLQNVKRLATDRNSYTTFIPDELVAANKKVNYDLVDNLVVDKEDQLKEILKIYKEVLSEADYKKLEKIVNKAKKSLRKSKDMETNNLYDKLRDLKLGSALTDVLGVVTSLAAVAVGLTKADDKDSRISATLKYGIPAVGSVAVTVLCTVGLVTSGPAFLIGMLSGGAINKAGTFADKKRKQYEEKPPTFSDAMNFLPVLKETILSS